jgi:hypothetical protein
MMFLGLVTVTSRNLYVRREPSEVWSRFEGHTKNSFEGYFDGVAWTRFVMSP